MLGAALLARAAAQVTVVSGGLECRLGPGEELLYLGPLREAGVVHGEVHAGRGGLRTDAYYTGWADTGVFTRDALVTNTGRVPVPAPSPLAWALPAGDTKARTTRRLAPGESMRPPAVAFTVATAGFDEAAGRLRGYLRRFVIPRAAGGRPLLAVFTFRGRAPAPATVQIDGEWRAAVIEIEANP